jgi:hypothetical protein
MKDQNKDEKFAPGGCNMRKKKSLAAFVNNC